MHKRVTLRGLNKDERIRHLVFAYLKKVGPATDQELQQGLHIPGNTERPRRIELEKAGVVQDSGWMRATRSGKLAIVWEVSPEWE